MVNRQVPGLLRRALRESDCLLLRRAADQNREPFIVEPRTEVPCPAQGSTDQMPDLAQERVSGVPTEHGAILSETINLEHDNAQTPLLAAAARWSFLSSSVFITR